MIPTLSRFSPTTPQLALTPTNNKSIANQSPHQRSGFSSGYLQRLIKYSLGDVYKAYERYGDTPSHELPEMAKDFYLAMLEPLKLRVSLCLECLRTDEFKEFKPGEPWRKIVEKINLLPPHTVHSLEIEDAFKEFRTERLSPYFSLEILCMSWEYFLTKVEAEISKFQTPAS